MVANYPLYLRVMNSINVKTLSGELSAAASLSPPPGSPSAVLFTPLVSAVAGAATGAGGGNGGGGPTVAVGMGGCGRGEPQAVTRRPLYHGYIRMAIYDFL